MVTIAPLAIFLGATATAALIFFAFWETLHGRAIAKIKGFADIFDRAGFRAKAEDIVITWITITAALWIGAAFLLRPSIFVGLILLPIAAAISGSLYWTYIQLRLKQRTEAFLNQFETVLRLMASGLRSGLGLQQTLALVSDESKEPARHEFARVLGKTNIGVGIHDALDDLAKRIVAAETLMMARVIRINAQTGGDMGRILEQLANTIKERRRMRRKISSLTAEGRIGAIVLGCIPIFLGSFITLTQADMGHGLLYTNVGHIVLLIIVVLEVCGIITLNRILKVDV
jgi:tight adherence protein B